MDLGLDEQQELLKNFARDFLEKECPESVVREMEAGSEEQKSQLLPKIAAGELIMTLALTEPSAKWDAGGVQLEAKKQGNDFVLNGVKLFVPDARVTDQMVVAARTSQGKTPEGGITLFLVDSRSSGISFAVLTTIASGN